MKKAGASHHADSVSFENSCYCSEGNQGAFFCNVSPFSAGILHLTQVFFPRKKVQFRFVSNLGTDMGSVDLYRTL